MNANSSYFNAQVNKLENRVNIELENNCVRELRTFALVIILLLYYKNMEINTAFLDNSAIM